MTKAIQTTFNYSALEPAAAKVAQAAALEIHAASKRCAETIIEIGKRLSGVKEILPHGSWLPWLEAEFGWSSVSAWRFMQVYEKFKSYNLKDLSMSSEVLYLLAAPSTPEAVREVAVDLSAAGQKVTPKTVQQLKESHKAEKQEQQKKENHLTTRPVERDDDEDLSDLEREQLDGFNDIEGLPQVDQLQYGGYDADGKYVILFRVGCRWRAIREDFFSTGSIHCGFGDTPFEAINHLNDMEEEPPQEVEEQEEDVEAAEFQMIEPEQEIEDEYDAEEIQPLDDEQLDPYSMTFIFLQARERCAEIAKSKKVNPIWANYTPRQAAFVLPIVISSRDWHNKVIDELKRLKGEEIDAE